MSDEQRKRFEVWTLKMGNDDLDRDWRGNYTNPDADMTWLAWQAATAAQQESVEPPSDGAREPDAWQFRAVIMGEPTSWLPCDSKAAAEKLRTMVGYEVRALYAAPAPDAHSCVGDARDAALVSASESMIGFVDSVFEHMKMNETRERFAHYVGKLRAAIAASKDAAA